MDAVTTSSNRIAFDTLGSLGRSGSSDFQTFLRMLTVQIQNQDPLNPIDSSDYAVQLATFSGVEQQLKTNNLLSEMGAQLVHLGMAQISNWVGREVRVNSPVWFDGMSPVSVLLKNDSPADQAIIVVRNASGDVVLRDDIDPSDPSYVWHGDFADGQPAPPGSYEISVERVLKDESTQSVQTEHYSHVIEATFGNAGVVLKLEGNINIDASKVIAIRE